MSSVVWFYSVNGKVSSPQTWDELCAAVKEQKLGPNDLVWTKAFGREWRKASTLEGLFGVSAPKIEPAQSNVDASNAEEDYSKVEERIQEEFIDIETEKVESKKSAEEDSLSYVCQRVGVRLGLKRAYYGMVNILFTSPFNIMRWIPLAVALFLASQMSSNFILNATDALFAEDGQIVSKLRENSQELGIPDAFYTSGIFSTEWKNDYSKLNVFLQEAQNQKLSQEEMSKQLMDIYLRLINGVGETTSYVWGWIRSFSGAITVATMFLMAFLMKIALFWFGARGKFIAMARCYNPTEPFGVTWRSVASASNRFFRMLVVVELITSIVYFCLSLTLIGYTANAFTSGQLTVEGFGSKVMLMIGFYALLMFLNYYLHNFVALPLLLEKQRLTLRYIFKGFGVWIIRFGIIYFALLLAIQFLLGFVGQMIGANLITMIFAMPITGQLLALPVFVVHLLWTMDITVQMRPELAKKRPPVDPWQVNR